jgi:hypothetical protein
MSMRGRWADAPTLLVLRYKDLVAHNMQYLTRIADFIGVPKPKSTSVDFAQLREQFPKFFRSTSNKNNVAELQGADRKLFWALHGKPMERMGYSSARPIARRNIQRSGWLR